jgi:integrase
MCILPQDNPPVPAIPIDPEALQALVRLLLEKIAAPGPGSEQTVDAVVQAYLADQQGEMTAESFAFRVEYLGRFCQEFGRFPAGKLTPSSVKAWIMSRPYFGSPWTRAAVKGMIMRVMNWAVTESRLLRENPIRGLKLTEEKRPGRDLKPEEFRAILRTSDVWFRRFMLAAAFTGARPCELRKLRWSEIDWVKGVAIQRTGKTVKKTGKPRVLVLPAPVMRLLAYIRRLRDKEGSLFPDADGVVFLNSKRGQWTRQALCTKFWRLRKLLGLPKDAKLYGCRHMFLTQSVKAGVSLKAAAALAGHTSTAMCEKHYVHVDQDYEYLHAAAKQAIGGGVFARRQPSTNGGTHGA